MARGLAESNSGTESLEGGRFALEGGPIDNRCGDSRMFVFMGDLPRGGGKYVLLLRVSFRVLIASCGSGAEPLYHHVSSVLWMAAHIVFRVVRILHIPDSMSMASDALMVASPRATLNSLSGDFAGDEKMPSRGSRPCSSRTPLSWSVIPVLLQIASQPLASNVTTAPNLPSLDADFKEVVRALLFGWRHDVLRVRKRCRATSRVVA